ncbi:C-type lectin domain containing 5A [Rhinolophus ferrumequinum]|uniref:C-type lectin domain family 5 member A n=1 Tax=Rhinolophus ferrumequinum TaxID=59479 RepID=A0A7J7RIA1_RHIFE|nr:C-type lectin domain containing 5A [Rhinolophus ferrumequinum]
MNWHMIISGLIVVVLKIVGTTLFLLYFPQIFGPSHESFSPTGSYGTGNVFPQIFGSDNISFSPTESSGTVCPRRWDFHQGRCFFLSTFEMSWNKSKDYCETEESTLAIVNTPEKLKFLQDITAAEKYFIGLLYQNAEKRWYWINNSIFNGNVTNHHQNFNCVTIGLTKTFDSALCDTEYRWICEKRAK